jgi:integrase
LRGHIRKRCSCGRERWAKCRHPWSVVFDVGRDHNGKRRQQWVTVKGPRREAERVARKALGSLDEGTWVEPSRLTLREFLEDRWLPSMESRVRPSTVGFYRRTVRVILPRLGTVPIQRITPDVLEVTYADLIRDGRTSVADVHRTLSKALEDAVDWSLLQANPARKAKAPKHRSPEMQTWTAEETRRFLAGVREHRLSAAWRLAVTTGLRRGEVLGVRWSDLDLDAGVLAVRHTILHDGEDIFSGEPKTSRGKRSVPLDAETIAALREHRKRQLEERLAASDYRDTDLVFCQPLGQPLHPSRFSKTFARLVREAGVRPIRLHDVRHTWATLALQAGVHPKVVSEILGHASVSFTLDRYSHAVPSLSKDATSQVADVINGAGG